MSKATLHNTMRVYHRYLGFFLAGIMAIYALSGFVLIFRDTHFLKRDKLVTEQLKPGLNNDDLGKAVRMRDLKILSVSGSVKTFKQGDYDTVSGTAHYTITTLPPFIDKLTHLHKASTKEPLFFLNVFFAVALLFFVLSSFWMFMPKTSIFKKGLYFTLAGIILTVIMLLV
ncbi:MAG: hypothetical protein JST86_01340 [Bacteroidetes bacterium]|nr:hypothetical protein [Bacteroidota bacterium]